MSFFILYTAQSLSMLSATTCGLVFGKDANFVPPASSNSVNGFSYRLRLDKDYIQLLTLPYIHNMRYATVKMGII